MQKSLANALAWLLPPLLVLLCTPLLIRYLGVERFGVWSLCALLAVLLPTFDLGFGVAAVRAFAARLADAESCRHLLAELLSVATVLGALCAALLWVAAAPLARWFNFDHALPAAEAVAVLRLLVPWVIAGFLMGVLTALPRAREQFVLLAAISAVNNVAVWGGAVALAALGRSIGSMLVLAAVAQLASVLMLLALHRRWLGRWPILSLRWGQLRALRGFALGSFAGSVTTLATYHADKLLVAAFLGPAAAGVYSALSNVARQLLGLTSALAAIVYPRVARLHQQEAHFAIGRTYMQASRALFTLNVAFAVVGLAVAGRFAELWLRAAADGPQVLAFRFLIVAYLLTGVSVVASNVLGGIGNARRGAWFAALGGALTLVAGFLLVPTFGVVGAALATAIGTSQAVLFDHLLERQLRSSLHGRLLARPRRWGGLLLASAAALVVCGFGLWLPHGWPVLLLTGAAGLAAFGWVWFRGGFARREERILYARLWARFAGGRFAWLGR